MQKRILNFAVLLLLLAVMVVISQKPFMEKPDTLDTEKIASLRLQYPVYGDH